MINGSLWCSLMRVSLFFRRIMDVKDVGEKWIKYGSRRNVILATWKRFCYGLRMYQQQ